MDVGSQPKVLVVLGPTAVGKTAWSIRLGRAFDGEIISADSRQIYRYMDIGTAKAGEAQQALVPHHLTGVVDPDQELTLAHYKQLAEDLIDEIWSRGRLPILSGGTGLYIRAVLEGWTVPKVPPNPALRSRLQEEAERKGHESLHARLVAVDPASASRIDARNVRRVIRALEVYYETGSPISRLQKKVPPSYRVLKIGLTMPREALYQRIDRRVDRMIEQGLEEEVRWLVERGYDYDLPAMSGLGYQQIGAYLRGEIGLEESVERIKTKTHRFVRHQYNWFRLSDSTIHWFNVLDMDERTLLDLVCCFIDNDSH